MKTYYPFKAAAKHSGVTKRTIYRWVHHGLILGDHRIRLKAIPIDSRPCIEELDLNEFLTARRKYREEQEKKYEKFTIP